MSTQHFLKNLLDVFLCVIYSEINWQMSIQLNTFAMRHNCERHRSEMVIWTKPPMCFGEELKILGKTL